MFFEQLVRLRKQKNITQRELAKTIGVSPSTLNCWEKGSREPNVLMIKALSKALDVSGDTLLETSFSEISSAVILSPPLCNHEAFCIKKYRQLPSERQAAVDNVLNFEYDAFLKEQNDFVSNNA